MKMFRGSSENLFIKTCSSVTDFLSLFTCLFRQVLILGASCHSNNDAALLTIDSSRPSTITNKRALLRNQILGRFSISFNFLSPWLSR